MRFHKIDKIIIFVTFSSMLLSACQSQSAAAFLPLSPTDVSQDSTDQLDLDTEQGSLTPFPTRPEFEPGALVDYVAQTGDTLTALASRFNTTVEEILAVNNFIPPSATTMPPGMPMKIPIYYQPFWGTPYQIIPDSLFINGPAQQGFNTSDFISNYAGWLSRYSGYAAGDQRTGAELVDLIALNYSISPRLLLALLEYQSGALSEPEISEAVGEYYLGVNDILRRGLYLQLSTAANRLNNGYYAWRIGELTSFEHRDGRLERPDPWQNAATVALQLYFSHLYDYQNYAKAVDQNGLAYTYQILFGDPWTGVESHIPGSLVQPEFKLPFKVGIEWALTGGPHTAWGQGLPYTALDFAPGALTGGCTPTDEWTTAVAPGIVVRSEPGTVVLDLDGDGDEHTGWVIFYFHVGTEGRAPIGAVLQTGDPIGHPSCEGGRTTGTHVHIARKYNGEWISAAGPLAFNLEGWEAFNGNIPYKGGLMKNSRTIHANESSDSASHIRAGDQ
jgi:LasA protease